jgi:hypothetical protein
MKENNPFNNIKKINFLHSTHSDSVYILEMNFVKCLCLSEAALLQSVL